MSEDDSSSGSRGDGFSSRLQQPAARAVGPSRQGRSIYLRSPVDLPPLVKPDRSMTFISGRTLFVETRRTSLAASPTIRPPQDSSRSTERNRMDEVRKAPGRLSPLNPVSPFVPEPVPPAPRSTGASSGSSAPRRSYVPRSPAATAPRPERLGRRGLSRPRTRAARRGMGRAGQRPDGRGRVGRHEALRRPRRAIRLGALVPPGRRGARPGVQPPASRTAEEANADDDRCGHFGLRIAPGPGPGNGRFRHDRPPSGRTALSAAGTVP